MRWSKPDECLAQEVIVVGNNIVIKLNGTTTIDFVDERSDTLSATLPFSSTMTAALFLSARPRFKESR